VYHQDPFEGDWDASCKGFIYGDPGTFIIEKCKIRLGFFWLFIQEMALAKAGIP
jgi:hypothetical protein